MQIPPICLIRGRLCSQMCKYSQEWAEKIAAKDTMEHRSEKKYGENIFCVWSNDPKFKVAGREAVESWYNEIKDHNFGCEPQAGVIKSGEWRPSKGSNFQLKYCDV